MSRLPNDFMTLRKKEIKISSKKKRKVFALFIMISTKPQTEMRGKDAHNKEKCSETFKSIV